MKKILAVIIVMIACSAAHAVTSFTYNASSITVTSAQGLGFSDGSKLNSAVGLGRKQQGAFTPVSVSTNNVEILYADLGAYYQIEISGGLQETDNNGLTSCHLGFLVGTSTATTSEWPFTACPVGDACTMEFPSVIINRSFETSAINIRAFYREWHSTGGGAYVALSTGGYFSEGIMPPNTQPITKIGLYCTAAGPNWTFNIGATNNLKLYGYPQ